MLRTFKSACACMRSQCPCRHDRRGPPPRHGASACGWRRALVHRSRGKAWRQRQATRSARQSMRQPMRQRVCSPCLPEAPRGRADPRPASSPTPCRCAKQPPTTRATRAGEQKMGRYRAAAVLRRGADPEWRRWRALGKVWASGFLRKRPRSTLARFRQHLGLQRMTSTAHAHATRAAGAPCATVSV